MVHSTNRRIEKTRAQGSSFHVHWLHANDLMRPTPGLVQTLTLFCINIESRAQRPRPAPHAAYTEQRYPISAVTMCQLCGISDIAAKHKWPKPLEASITDLKLLITTAHDEYEANKSLCASKTSIPESLLDILRLLSAAIDDLENGREAWWISPEKKAMRRRLDEECSQAKLTELHRINNATAERTEAMQARLGTFVKWTLGLDGGVWELVESVKVKAGGESTAAAVELA
jgi:hypothetical protein